ncbi:MAG: class I SAM-dependent methyltransferase [Ruminococcaceae bacterium]|nr:class I SAM-dependent methyltransferase [Oscillospiraceae bacterium]
MYSIFADFYDELMYDVDYKKRTAYLMRLFKKYGKAPTLLLDVACGTGGFSNEFAKLGVEVIGTDISEEMLGIARENSADMGQEVLYLCQAAEELDLYGTVDGAVCCLDSLNHITDYKTLCKAFQKVSLFLEKDCLFIFDVNTEYKHREILGDNVFVMDREQVYCVWANEYNPKKNTVNIMLDFFVKEGDNYSRLSEEFYERAYTIDELTAALEKAGLEIVGIFDDMTEKPLKDDSQRAIYVTKKV